ncbi:helix-turn-helix domain-containing protein [Streptomyces sp. NPDC001940]|uniref:helix-turn-helix domain-containing protein n=1 Tax=Streptomyces sp. NPDC056105 TaxID=3345714 RepID=UPI0035D7F61C
MKVRADIAALIRRGHTDVYIAGQVSCHRTTVARTRRALRIPPAQPLGHVLAEAVPTGKVRDYRPAHGLMPLSPEQQRANRELLLAALRGEAA